MTHTIFASVTASVTELKKNPMGTVAAGEGATVAILNRNQPAFYCVPTDVYQELMDIAEDYELGLLISARKDEVPVPVSLDEL